MTSHNDDAFFGGRYAYSHRIPCIITLVIIFCVLRIATIMGLTFVNYTLR